MLALVLYDCFFFFFFQAEDGIRDLTVTGVQTCALPIFSDPPERGRAAPRGRHHGRQRSLGAGAQPTPAAGPPGGDEGGARGGRRRARGRGGGAHAIRLLGGELAAPCDRDLRADAATRGVYRA